MTKRPAIFLDRDGTLVEEVNFLSRVEDLRLFPFSESAVRQLKDAGYLIVVVTNQSGIGRGIYSEADMHAIHEAIQKELNGAIDAFYFCPHLPGSGCECRKPKTGMITAALRDLDIATAGSWMIGDKKIDVETGIAANLRTALVLTGYGAQHRGLLKVEPDLICDDMGSAVAEIVSAKFSDLISEI
jgi:D-glycero-D-manno-heptose 1,7-bisphosphate phosphatase